MPRPSRPHLPTGLYYVVQRAATQQHLFREPSDYEHFTQLLRRRAVATRAQVLAYAWLPCSIHLIIRIQQVPIGRMMQGLTSTYARYLHRARLESGHVFARRFHSVLLDPKVWLLSAVRHVHYAPIHHSFASHINRYHYSSAAAYAHPSEAEWIDTASVCEIARSQGYTSETLETYLHTRPPEEELQLWDPTGKPESRVLGDTAFRARLTYSHRDPRARPTLQELIALVARSLGLDERDLYARSRAHVATLARALVTWHAIERRIATLSQVAREFGRDASSLSKAIQRHRRTYPHLFVLNALHRFVPLDPRMPRAEDPSTNSDT